MSESESDKEDKVSEAISSEEEENKEEEYHKSSKKISVSVMYNLIQSYL